MSHQFEMNNSNRDSIYKRENVVANQSGMQATGVAIESLATSSRPLRVDKPLCLSL
jgi:hypothetical protein